MGEQRRGARPAGGGGVRRLNSRVTAKGPFGGRHLTEAELSEWHAQLESIRNRKISEGCRMARRPILRLVKP